MKYITKIKNLINFLIKDGFSLLSLLFNTDKLNINEDNFKDISNIVRYDPQAVSNIVEQIGQVSYSRKKNHIKYCNEYAGHQKNQ